MKMFKLPCFLILLLSTINFAQVEPIRVMTYNIRYANNNPGEEWDLRKNKLAEMIRFHNPEIFGLQEALKIQVDFLKSEFKNYQVVGVGRDDGITEGEFSPLFISNEYKIKNFGTFWLSETPDFPSKGWDANLNRIATWAVIQNQNSDSSIFIINTHLDHQGEIARIESVRLIMQKIEKLSNKLPVILMGDFNFSSESEAYKYIQDFGLVKDSQNIAKYNYGTNNTFNGFEKEIIEPRKIDFIFVSGNLKVLHHAIIGDKLDNRFPSDHMPVIIDLDFLN